MALEAFTDRSGDLEGGGQKQYEAIPLQALSGIGAPQRSSIVVQSRCSTRAVEWRLNRCGVSYATLRWARVGYYGTCSSRGLGYN